MIWREGGGKTDLSWEGQSEREKAGAGDKEGQGGKEEKPIAGAESEGFILTEREDALKK